MSFGYWGGRRLRKPHFAMPRSLERIRSAVVASRHSPTSGASNSFLNLGLTIKYSLLYMYTL